MFVCYSTTAVFTYNHLVYFDLLFSSLVLFGNLKLDFIRFLKFSEFQSQDCLFGPIQSSNYLHIGSSVLIRYSLISFKHMKRTGELALALWGLLYDMLHIIICESTCFETLIFSFISSLFIALA